MSIVVCRSKSPVDWHRSCRGWGSSIVTAKQPGQQIGALAMPYLADWKHAKENFERVTGKGKPSEKFLGAFRKSSGIEDACKLLDTAETSGDLKKIATAQASFSKALNNYKGTLQKALVGEETTTYKGEVKKLQDLLDGMVGSFAVKKSKVEEEIINRLSKRSAELLHDFVARMENLKAIMTEIEREEAIANHAMVKIAEALHQNAADKAKQEINRIDESVKVVRNKKVALKKMIELAEKNFERDAKTFEIAGFDGDKNRFMANLVQTRSIVLNMRDLTAKADESVVAIEEDLNRAKGSMKGEIDANENYVRAISKLSKRGIDLNKKLDAEMRLVSEQINQAAKQSDEAYAIEDPILRAKLLDKAIEKVESQKSLFKNIADSIEKGEGAIKRELNSYPQGLESIAEFNKTKGDVIGTIDHFENIKNELKKTILKGVKIEKKH